MEQKKINLYRVFVILASFVVIVAGIKSASSVVTPFLLSLFLAIVSLPLINRLERLGLNRFFSFIVVLVFVVIVLSLFVYILSSSLNNFTSNIPFYKEKLMDVLLGVEKIFNRFGLDFRMNDVLAFVDPTKVLNYTGVFLKSFSSIISKSFLIFLGTSFILFETVSWEKKIHLISRQKEEFLGKFSKSIQRYLAIKSFFSLLTGVLIAAGLYFLGIEYALLLGLIAFLLNFIPAIGSALAFLPAFIVTLVGNDIYTLIYVSLLYLGVNILIGNIVEPRYLGKGLGLSVLIVFLSLLFWGFVLGPVGMFLAIPISMTLKIALSLHPDTKVIAFLLGNDTKEINNV